MKKLSCLLLVALTLLGPYLFFHPANASTSVAGLIASDTTWTTANNPYVLTGPVCVMTGAALTIQPGVTVNLGSYYMLVNGTLNAQGTGTNTITVTAAKATNGINPPQIQFNPSSTGSIIDHAVLNQVSIIAKGCSLTVSNNIFANPIRLALQCTDGGSATITGNVFQNVWDEGVSVGGSSTVTGNLFNITVGWATAIVAHENTYVSSNQILGFYRGVMSDGSGTIEGNVVENCVDSGIVSQGAANILQNYVSDNQVGIAYFSGNVRDNSFVHNKVGAMIQSSATGFVNNNIIGSTQYQANITTGNNANVPNNWWGTTDINAINQTIWDFKDDFNLGVVNFTPILTTPSSDAPTSPTINVTVPAFSSSPQPNQTNPANSPASTSSPPSESTPLSTQYPPQNPIFGPIGGSNVMQLVTLIVLVAVAMLLATLIILTIRKRTSPQKATKLRGRRKTAGRV